MKESKLFRSLAATFVVIGLGASSIVLAQTGTPVNITVSYADLNLENEEGAKALYRRLQNASKKACGSTAGQSSGIIGRVHFDQCYRETLADLVEKVDSANLTRVHAG